MQRENEVGLKLRKIRRERDITQEELANLLGTSKQVISRYERGDRTPKWETILKWAKILQINVTDLIDKELIYDDDTDKEIIDSLEPVRIIEGTSQELGSLIGVLSELGIGIISTKNKYFITNDTGGIEIGVAELNKLIESTTQYINFTFNDYINKKLRENLKL